MNNKTEFEPEDASSYRLIEEIDQNEIVEALCRLTFFKSDPFLRMQAHNLALVDQFIMKVEIEVLTKLIQEDRTPPDTIFLSAQSQLWIFGMYELLRTWKERVSNIKKWAENGGLQDKLTQYEKGGFNGFGRKLRADELKAVIADKSLVEKIKSDIQLVHIVFSRLEAIRVLLAKHQITGKPKSVAFMPGYGRINRECGSLDYQLENEAYIIGNISRRDIADEVRNLLNAEPQSSEELKEFDLFMRGPNASEIERLFEE